MLNESSFEDCFFLAPNGLVRAGDLAALCKPSLERAAKWSLKRAGPEVAANATCQTCRKTVPCCSTMFCVDTTDEARVDRQASATLYLQEPCRLDQRTRCTSPDSAHALLIQHWVTIASQNRECALAQRAWAQRDDLHHQSECMLPRVAACGGTEDSPMV